MLPFITEIEKRDALTKLNERKVYVDLEQKTEEWQQKRLGKITGSTFGKLFGTKDCADKHIYSIANEIITNSRSDGAEFTNFHMDRGNNYEPLARVKYMEKNFEPVKTVGIVCLGGYVACSPDGLVGEDGVIEIKVPDSHNYLKYVLEISQLGKKAIQKDHFMQMQFNMYVCDKDWCDYVLYNPKHVFNDLSIFRIEKDKDIQAKIENTIDDAIARIKRHIKQYSDLITI